MKGGVEKSKNAKNRKSRDELRSQYRLRLYRGLRGHSALYIPFYRLFLLFASLPPSACQSFLLPLPTLFHFPRLRHRSSSRRMFVPTVLYHPAIISHTCHSPSVSPLPPSVIPPILTHTHAHPYTHYPTPLAALSRGLL